MMRIFKIFLFFLLVSGLIGFAGRSSLLIADQTDPPHFTHISGQRGPNLGTNCGACHTDSPETHENASQDSCYPCHSEGGTYDGVNDGTIGAVNNWENTGSSTGATESKIYNTDGSLKVGKGRWCAGCHDQDPAGVLLDNFEGYTDDSELRTEWLARQDARRPFLMTNDGPDGSQSMLVRLVWDYKANREAGFVKRSFSPYVDLRGADALRLYMKVSNKKRIKNIRVKLIKEEGGVAIARVLKRSLKNGQWQRVTLRRSDFSDTTWGKVTGIQIFIREKDPAQDYRVTVSVDDIRALNLEGNWAPNVIGDNSTYGFYVSGHGTLVNCTWCHDPSSDHLDDEQRPVFDYIKDRENPTGFRFYSSDPTKSLQLPYTEYVEGDTGSFALCYRCHDEACITQDALPSALGTNFKDTNWIAAGPANLHLLHVGGTDNGGLAPEVFHGTCVLCHDVMAPRKPAMTRREMGNFIYFDNNGCEVTDPNDWVNPTLNIGGAQTEGIFTYFPTLCMTCHLDGVPPNPDCTGSNPYVNPSGMDGWYERTYEEACGVAPVSASHTTHFTDPKGPMLGGEACDICHGESSLKDACITCHSPGGAFDGIDDPEIGAWTNWADGVYESDGKTLKAGKERWCAGCHDDGVANSEADGSGVDAPNITGDDATYGFYVTGHKISCLDCHDASKNHLDGEHRTYRVTEGTPPVVVNDYTDSYRLRKIKGGPALYVPRLVASSNPLNDALDFALCLDCHNRTDLLQQVVSGTNFWNDDDQDRNSHNIHLASVGIRFDSDWDDLADSQISCIACHNVHGPPNVAMVRHGELISTPGTADKVPALNFSYLLAGNGAATGTASWTPDIVTAGSYKVYAWWTAASNRATNAQFEIFHAGGGSPTIVTKNQQINGSQWNLLGTFSFAAGTSGYVELSNQSANGQVIADAVQWVKDPETTPVITIDNGDADFSITGPWSCISKTGAYNGDLCFIDKPPAGTPDPNATLAQSAGGIMDYAGPTIVSNGVCDACHGAVIYERSPNLSPKVISAKANPDMVVNNGSGTTLISATVYDPDGDFGGNIVVDLTPIGGSASQLMYDNGTNGDVSAGDGIYSYEATVSVGTPDTPQSLVITATDGASNQGTGTLTLFVIVPGGVYLDQEGATFLCSWSYALKADAYNGDLRFINAGTGSCTATWTPDIPVAGNYSVYAWWTTNTNRATDAPYTINHDGGSQTIDVNQQINGSQWNLLGTFSFAAGTSGTVVLSDDANGQVIADAIKLVP